MVTSTTENFLAFYKSEEDWKKNNGQGVKLSLEDSFLVDKADFKRGSGPRGILLTFVGTSRSGQIGIAFDSLTKMDQWHKALIRMSHTNNTVDYNR